MTFVLFFFFTIPTQRDDDDLGSVIILFLWSSIMKKMMSTQVVVIFFCYSTTKRRTTTPLLSQPHFGAKCENAIHTPKSGKMESSETPENSEDNLRGQISLPWSVLYINEKVLKRRCPKWPRLGHLDICSPSCGQKKGRESNCQFDSRPLKVGNRPLPDIASRSATRRWKDLDESYNFGSNLVLIRVRGEEL